MALTVLVRAALRVAFPPSSPNEVLTTSCWRLSTASPVSGGEATEPPAGAAPLPLARPAGRRRRGGVPHDVRGRRPGPPGRRSSRVDGGSRPDGLALVGQVLRQVQRRL